MTRQLGHAGHPPHPPHKLLTQVRTTEYISKSYKNKKPMNIQIYVYINIYVWYKKAVAITLLACVG